MKKLFFVAIVSGFLGFLAGNAFWYLASPLWIDVRVAESASAAETTNVLARGQFRGADSVHKGSGTAILYQGTEGRRLLRLTEFQVTNGPDLKVWLVGKANVTSSQDVTDNDYLALGRLKGNIGDQNYDIPANVDLSQYHSVVIWCEQFSVLFAVAALSR